MKKFSYILWVASLITFFMTSSCNQTKYVPEGQYLLKKNKIEIEGAELDEYKITSVLKQEANHKTLGVKFKLWIFNRLDSTKIAKKRIRKNAKIRRKNNAKLLKEEKINKKRILEALENDNDYYRRKRYQLKDTLQPRKFLREWLKYEVGEAPEIYNEAFEARSVEQLNIYLKKKGYYFGNVSSTVKFKEKSRKAIVSYKVVTGEPYMVDSIYVIGKNRTVLQEYENFKKEDEFKLKPPFIFDSELLDQQREAIAKHNRDRTIYGFRKKYITYEAFTDSVNMTVDLGIRFAERFIENPNDPETRIKKPFSTFRIKDVYFHISDTINYDGNFKKDIDGYGLQLTENGYLQTLDTLFFNEYLPINEPEDSIFRQAYFLYNRELSVKPSLIEFCNFLENENVYKAYYVERSYQRLIQLGLFQTVKPKIIEVDGERLLEIHYYLVPSKKQSFGFEPRATNSNGYLGVSASINYKNKNLFKGGEKLTISLSGGFESQPSVFDQTIDGEQIQTSGRSFNTIEYGPSIKLELPGILPFVKFQKLSKRHYPSTILSSAYNFQKRDDFDRQLVQFNYGFKFSSPEGNQVYQVGMPLLSSIQYVKLEKSNLFEARLDSLNDLFLLNTYSDQFIWKDLRFTYEYSNKKVQKKNLLFYFDTEFDLAGVLLQLLTLNQPEDSIGFKKIFGVRYSEFVRLDNEFKLYQTFKKKKKNSLNYRIALGAGLPFSNNATSLPFDYAFFAGGSNDNRGWKARALGPGTYKYYLDTNRTSTQVGDIRLGGNVEYRFNLGGYFRGAVFVDAGNIWTINDDPNRPGSKFSSNFYNELGIATGFGVRLDVDFFILRLDLGLPIRNPALPKGSRWIIQSRQPYFNEAELKFGENYKSFIPRPFIPQLHLGIGFPF